MKLIEDNEISCTCLFMAEFTDENGDRMEHRVTHSATPLSAEELINIVGKPDWAAFARCHAFPYDPAMPEDSLDL